MRIFLDAGPALTFLAVGQQNILIRFAEESRAQLTVAEQVDHEIKRKSEEPRFASTGAGGTWGKLCSTGHIEVLSDVTTPGSPLAAAVSRVSGLPASQSRPRAAKDFGEIMSIAHASAHVQANGTVQIVIEDGPGRLRVHDEALWLNGQGYTNGIETLGTGRIMKQVGLERPAWIQGKKGWKAVYADMCGFDDALVRL